MGNNSWVMILVVGVTAGWIITTWVRAKYGYPLDDGAGNRVYKDQPREEVVAVLENALVTRDERIAALEERVRVLERIATDRRTALDEEIGHLRTSP